MIKLRCSYHDIYSQSSQIDYNFQMMSTSPAASIRSCSSDAPNGAQPAIKPTLTHATPPANGDGDDDDNASDPLLTRLILNPLSFLSFLIALLFIDSRAGHAAATQARPAPQPRAASQPAASAAPHPGAGALHRSWSSPEPGTAPPAAWVWRARRQRIARWEVGRALELRGVVAGLVVAGLAAVLAVLAGGGWWVLGRWWA
jgi:hypothetical protein